MKAENGAAVPAPAEVAPDAPKKGEKKDKKGKKGAESKEGDAKKEEGEATQKQGNKDNLRELPNGLKIQDAKIGDGPQVKKGTHVSMRYIGKLPNGKVFDSNTKGKPVRRSALPVIAKDSCDRPSSQFTFRLGAGEVIKGM